MFKVRVTQVLVDTQFLNREDAERAVRELRRDYPNAVVTLFMLPTNPSWIEIYTSTPQAG